LIVKSVIGHTVANHETLKVRDITAALVLSAVSNVPIDSLNKARNINSGVGLSSNVKILALKLRELVHYCEECLKVIISGIEVIPFAFI
jgi:hypothetical protein